MADYTDADRAKELARRRAIDTAFTFRANGHECNDHGGCQDCCDSDLRIRMVPDDVCDMEDLKGDMFNPTVNNDMDPAVLAEEEEAFEASVMRFGVWGLVAEYKDNAGVWVIEDSIFGLCDDDAVALYTAELKERLMVLVEPTPDSWCAL